MKTLYLCGGINGCTWWQMWDYMRSIYNRHLHEHEKSISEILEP